MRQAKTLVKEPKAFAALSTQVRDAQNHAKAITRSMASQTARRMLDDVVERFLGGVEEGSSTGLRKWYASHAHGLQICDLIGPAATAFSVKDSTGTDPNVRRAEARSIVHHATKIADVMRERIPRGYQQASDAHPYLPFFPRIMEALRSLERIDPDADDDIEILDENDAAAAAAPKAGSSRAAAAAAAAASAVPIAADKPGGLMARLAAVEAMSVAPSQEPQDVICLDSSDDES